MLSIKTILHPTDFSEQSDLAFRFACELAEQYHAHLIVLHVERPTTALCYDGVMLPDLLDFQEQLEEKLCHMRPASPRVFVEHCLLQGEPAGEIVRKAKEVPCDLIVMGTHGRTGFKRLVLGSVAEKVLHKASCPVLTVKVPQPHGSPATVPLEAAVGSGAQARNYANDISDSPS